MENTQTNEQTIFNSQPSTTANQSAESNQATADDNTAAVPAPVLYDATVTQRFPFSVREDGELIETAHIFKPIDDAKHLNYLRELVKIRDGERNDKTLNELTADFWRDLIESIENLETEPGTDFRDVPDAEEEIAPLTVSYLTVIVKQPTIAQKRKRSPIKTKNQTVTTQAYFNGEVCEQKHILAAKSDEWRKKYNRISRSQYVEDKNGTGDAKLKFVPAYEEKLALYDEMFIEATGFAADTIPARFKLAAIDAAFETSVVDAKK